MREIKGGVLWKEHKDSDKSQTLLRNRDQDLLGRLSFAQTEVCIKKDNLEEEVNQFQEHQLENTEIVISIGGD